MSQGSSVVPWDDENPHAVDVTQAGGHHPSVVAGLGAILGYFPFPPRLTSLPSHCWQSHGLATAPDPFAPTTQVERQGDGGTRLQKPPLNLPQASGKSPAPAPSLSRLQPNCRPFPGREARGCPGCTPRAGLVGAARVPSPRARGSPYLLSSRRTGGS